LGPGGGRLGSGHSAAGGVPGASEPLARLPPGISLGSEWQAGLPRSIPRAAEGVAALPLGLPRAGEWLPGVPPTTPTPSRATSSVAARHSTLPSATADVARRMLPEGGGRCRLQFDAGRTLARVSRLTTRRARARRDRARVGARMPRLRRVRPRGRAPPLASLRGPRGTSKSLNQSQKQREENTTMDGQRHGRGPGERLQLGAAILANARVVDTTLVKRRLAAFQAAHRNYAAVQDKVQAAEVGRRGAIAKVARRERIRPSRRWRWPLAVDGHPRTKPSRRSAARKSDVGWKPPSVKTENSSSASRSRAVVGAAGHATRGRARAPGGRPTAQAALPRRRFAGNGAGRAAAPARDPGQPWDRALAMLRRAPGGR
jgi:hypothetical protein